MSLLQRLASLLLAANILFLLWVLISPAPMEESASGPLDAATTLVHISELSDLPPPGYPTELIESEGAGVSSSSTNCFMAGPFESIEAAQVAMMGSGISFDVRSRRRPLVDAPLYRAMIPPSANFEDAQLRLSEVIQAIERIGGGIDTYMVTSGPIANAISLGLFSEEANAINVQSLLAAQGVEVVIKQEIRMETGYWVVANSSYLIDFMSETGDGQGMEAGPAELSENLCEMIAQAR